MPIEAWTGPLVDVDNTYGYNDYLLRPGGNPMVPIVPGDTISAQELTSPRNPSAGLSDGLMLSIEQPGDRLFRLPNGGVLLRRSIFADRCLTNGFSPNNVIAMSDTMTRAVAYFSRTMVDASWCRPHYAGVVQEGGIRDQATHWDLTVGANLQRLRGFLTALRDVNTDPASARDALARDLAGAVSREELNALIATVDARMEQDRNAVESLLHKPWYRQIWEVAPIAVGFSLVTGIAGIGVYLLFGGESPFKDFRIFGGIRTLLGGAWRLIIKDQSNRRPPDDPGASGGSAAGGATGTANTPAQAPADTGRTSRMAGLPDVAAGILTFNGAYTPNAAPVGGIAPGPSSPYVATPVVNPGVIAIPVIPTPVAVPPPMIAPPAVVPRFVPAI